MSVDQISEDPLTPRQKARLRWQAVEGFNSLHGLIPMERRLGIALISTMDSKSGGCFPSELFLATKLGVHVVSIKKAKAQLRDMGLITWENPGGPRHVSHYIFNWKVLCGSAVAANENAKKVALESRLARRKSNAESINERWGTNTAPDVRDDRFKVAKAAGSGSLNLENHSVQAFSKVARELPDITHGTAQSYNLPHSQHENATIEHLDLSNPFPMAAKAQPTAATNREASLKNRCHFPQLVDGFQDEPEMLELINRLPFDLQDQAVMTLAQKNKTAARKVIIKHFAVE